MANLSVLKTNENKIRTRGNAINSTRCLSIGISKQMVHDGQVNTAAKDFQIMAGFFSRVYRSLRCCVMHISRVIHVSRITSILEYLLSLLLLQSRVSKRFEAVENVAKRLDGTDRFSKWERNCALSPKETSMTHPLLPSRCPLPRTWQSALPRDLSCVILSA